tara:strand:+ start:223 stop:459 length:237 start_codon:yes stop_codon:yes gene_type:complete
MDKEDTRFAVTSFLQMCVEYSDNSIQRKTQRLSDENSDELKQEIDKWVAYKEFTEYAIKELKQGELEDWLEKIVKEYK